MKSLKKVQFLLLAAVLMLFGADTYQKPPKVVEDILNSAATPTIQLSPTHAYAMQGRPVRYPPIAELAQPMRRLAGIRINPTTNGLHNATFNSALTLRKVPEGTDIKVALPANPKLSTGRKASPLPPANASTAPCFAVKSATRVTPRIQSFTSWSDRKSTRLNSSHL